MINVITILEREASCGHTQNRQLSILILELKFLSWKTSHFYRQLGNPTSKRVSKTARLQKNSSYAGTPALLDSDTLKQQKDAQSSKYSLKEKE